MDEAENQLMLLDTALECPICGLPFDPIDPESGRRREYVSIHHERLGPWPSELDYANSARDAMRQSVDWTAAVTLLCDPEDEMGQLIPSFVNAPLGDNGQVKNRSHPAYLDRATQVQRTSQIDEHQGEYLGGLSVNLIQAHTRTRIVLHRATFDGRVYIAVHSACLDLAKRVQRAGAGHITTMRGLFLALRWRHAMKFMFGEVRAEANYKLGPACQYRPFGTFWHSGSYGTGGDGEAKWPGPSRDAEFNLKYTFLSSPVPTGTEDTAFILSNLEQCWIPDKVSNASPLYHCISILPKEIHDMILGYLHGSRKMRHEPSYVLPQSVWLHELLEGDMQLTPWFWAMDRKQVLSKAAAPCPGGEDYEWDWERLVRQLTCGVDGGIRCDVPTYIDVYAEPSERDAYRYEEDLWECTGYHNFLKKIPLPQGLHNRRRIWQLLEEMFVGDQLPLAGHEYFNNKMVPPLEEIVQFPWTKEGEMRKDAIWLPSIQRDASFARRIGGEVYKIDDLEPAQYWKPGAFLQEEEGNASPSVAEILKVISNLGYPVYT